MDEPTARNRLDEAASPYLQVHADNPVHWQPWDDQALQAARERDVPIFLSVGYSACHWCHVMEEESFDDEAVAAVLNDGFVPIKVDREERPDLDRIYQTVCQQVSGRGGWPLSVWLTPEGKPFYVGTYFPRESRRGMPGFLDVLESIEESWTEEREDVLDRADQWAATARNELEAVPDDAGTSIEPGDDEEPNALFDTAMAIRRTVDRQHGGFGNSGPKFPQPPRIDVLLRAADRAKSTTATAGSDDTADPASFRTPATETLDAMANGGLYDHLGGGFHRYATDREWVVPHFEKMLYDNAELPRVYADGYRQTGDERYRSVIEETVDFVGVELSHPDGGCYSTLNAQSPVPAERRDADGPGADEEGAFYVWTPEEVHDAMDSDLAELFCARYGVTDRGNFEGKTVLTIDTTVEELADDRDTGLETIREQLETARAAALEHRAGRPRPSRDEKVIGAWNGLFAGATADAALAIATLEPAPAVEAIEFVREQLWDGDRLARWYKDGAVGGDGYLEEYAFLGRGALRCFEATGDIDHLAFAISLAETIEDAFWDSDEGTLYFTPADGEQLIARPQEPTDQSTPSSLGVATQLLLLLDPFVPHDRFHEIGSSVVDTYRGELDQTPLRHPTLSICADLLAGGPTEITLAAESPPAEWLAAIGELYLPNRLLAHRPPTAAGLNGWLDRLGFDQAPPIWAERTGDDGPTAYVCRDQTCSPPLSSPNDVPEWLDRLSR